MEEIISVNGGEEGNLTDKAGASCSSGQNFVHFDYHSSRSQSTSPSCVSSHFS